MTDSFHLDIKGCIKNKGIVCIPLPELLKLFNTYPYHLGKEFKSLFEQAAVSDKIQEINEETK